MSIVLLGSGIGYPTYRGADGKTRRVKPGNAHAGSLFMSDEVDEALIAKALCIPRARMDDFVRLVAEGNVPAATELLNQSTSDATLVGESTALLARTIAGIRVLVDCEPLVVVLEGVDANQGKLLQIFLTDASLSAVFLSEILRQIRLTIPDGQIPISLVRSLRVVWIDTIASFSSRYVETRTITPKEVHMLAFSLSTPEGIVPNAPFTDKHGKALAAALTQLCTIVNMYRWKRPSSAVFKFVSKTNKLDIRSLFPDKRDAELVSRELNKLQCLEWENQMEFVSGPCLVVISNSEQHSRRCALEARYSIPRFGCNGLTTAPLFNVKIDKISSASDGIEDFNLQPVDVDVSPCPIEEEKCDISRLIGKVKA